MFLSQKAGAIQNPADINAVNESGVRLSNEVGKLLIGTRLVHGVIFFWFAETLSFRAGRKQTVLLSQIDIM